MSTHSSPPISVGQNVSLPNPTTPLSITPSASPSKMSIFRAELLELKQTQSEQFQCLDQQRQLESENTRAFYHHPVPRQSLQPFPTTTSRWRTRDAHCTRTSLFSST